MVDGDTLHSLDWIPFSNRLIVKCNSFATDCRTSISLFPDCFKCHSWKPIVSDILNLWKLYLFEFIDEFLIINQIFKSMVLHLWFQQILVSIGRGSHTYIYWIGFSMAKCTLLLVCQRCPVFVQSARNSTHGWLWLIITIILCV